MKKNIGKLNFKIYFMVISISGFLSFLWLLFLPSDLKTAWIFGFSKNRFLILGGILLAVLASILIWFRMAIDEKWMQKFYDRLDYLLSKNLFWIIVLTLSSFGFLGGVCVLAVSFGLTDIFLQNIFLRLAPLALWIMVICIVNMVYFWYGDYAKDAVSPLKRDIQGWQNRYEITSRYLIIIFFFPTIYLVLYFALWKSQPDHTLALRFMGENNPIELITFLALFFGGINGIRLSRSAQKRGEAIWVWAFFAVFAIGIIFVALEEIAWGQQFFDIKTPSALKEINLQNEITFHNIESVQSNLGRLIRIFGWFGVIGILLSFTKRFQIIGVSPLLILWVLMILVLSYLSRFINSILPAGIDYVLLDVISETGEMFVGLVSYFYIWFQTRMLSYGKLRKAIAHKATFSAGSILLELADRRRVIVPIDWIHPLKRVNIDEVKNFYLTVDGLVLNWPDLDLSIRVEQILSGALPIENRSFFD